MLNPTDSITVLFSPNKAYAPITPCNSATMTTDGPVLMSTPQLVQNVARHLLSHNSYIIRQFPHSLGVRIDPDVFLSAFSFVDDNGDQVNIGPWKTAPTGYSRPRPSSSTADENTEEETEVDPDAGMTPTDRAMHDTRQQYLTTWAIHSSAMGRFIGRGQELTDELDADMPAYQKRKGGKTGKWR